MIEALPLGPTVSQPSVCDLVSHSQTQPTGMYPCIVWMYLHVYHGIVWICPCKMSMYTMFCTILSECIALTYVHVLHKILNKIWAQLLFC